MFGCFVDRCLRMFCFQFFFCFGKLGLHACPGLCGVISLVQCFCFCDSLFQCCCALYWISTYNISFRCFKGIRSICITKCMNRNLPVSSSIGSFRELAANGICQSELNSHRFMHPVICRKFCTIGCFGIGVSSVIAIVSPGYRLQISSQVTIIAIQIHTEKLAIRTIGIFYSQSYCFCIWSCLQHLIFDSRFTSCCSCREGETSVFILRCCFQSVGILCYICNKTDVAAQFAFRESTI